MLYRIELSRKDEVKYEYLKYDVGYAYNALEVKTYLAECVGDDYRVEKIVKITKDGRGYDVTGKYIR